MAYETVRLLRRAGVATCLLVAAPSIVEGIGETTAFVVWLAAFAVYAGLYAWTIAHLEPPGRALQIALAAQAVSAIVMSATDYHGLEGTLLVLVALQLGFAAPRRVGVTWIVIQSLALMWAIEHHWSVRPALMWAPPYFGFQLLTFLMVDMVEREARSRAESARLGERLRIARELHDSMGHHIVGLSLNLEALMQRQGPSPQLDAARSLTRRLLDDVESLVDTLGRDHRVDLGSALAALVTEIPRPRIHVDARDVVVHDPERTHTLWRCCQEIVTNAAKHAQADNLWMTIQVHDGRVELTAIDDGAGAAHVDSGSGLDGMRQRLEALGGALVLETRPGAGFHVRVTLPCGPA